MNSGASATGEDGKMCDFMDECSECDAMCQQRVTNGFGDKPHCYMPLTTQKEPVAESPACNDRVMCDGYFKGVTEEAIKILGEYLPPDGVDAHGTLSRLLGVFDNEEIVAKLKST